MWWILAGADSNVAYLFTQHVVAHQLAVTSRCVSHLSFVSSLALLGLWWTWISANQVKAERGCSQLLSDVWIYDMFHATRSPQCGFCQRSFNSRPGEITTKFNNIYYHIAPYSQCRHVRLVVLPHSIKALGTNPQGLFCLCLQRKGNRWIGDSDLMWPDCERLVTPSCLLAAGIGNWWSGAYS